MTSLLKYVERMILDEVPETVITRGNSTLTISTEGCGEDLRFYVNFEIKTSDDEVFDIDGHINMIDAYQDSIGVWWNLEANKTKDIIDKFGAFGFVYDFNDGSSRNWEEMYEMILMMREESDKGEDEKSDGKGDEKQGVESHATPSTETEDVTPGLTLEPFVPAMSLPAFPSSVLPTIASHILPLVLPPEQRVVQQPKKPTELKVRRYTPQSVSTHVPDKDELFIVIDSNFIIRHDLNNNFIVVGKDVDGVMVPLTSEHVTREEIDLCQEIGLLVPQELGDVMTKSALKR